MKKILLSLFCLALFLGLAAQNIDDMIFEDNDQRDTGSDIIKLNYQKKDARKAMLFSTLLPGAGQFYADKGAFTTYLFPALEVAMIGGIIYFNLQGNDKTDKFENYANGENITQTFNYTVNGVDYSYTYTGPRYSRVFQSQVEGVLKDVNAYDIYDDSFFRLDATNTQHFYEDIGKYNKYVFGWADWYYAFATDPASGDFILDNPAYEDTWIWAGSTDPQLIHLRRWTSNLTIEDFMNGDVNNPVPPGTDIASPMRKTYIDMRNEANQQYSYARLFTLGLAFNHIASAVDAILLTNKVNRGALSQNDLKLYYYTDMRSERFTPSVGLSYSF
jgi:hypothetical protein